MAITANRYLTLFLLFVAASISYAVGFIVGFWLLIAVGVVFELVFWLEFLSGKRRRELFRILHENQPSELERITVEMDERCGNDKAPLEAAWNGALLGLAAVLAEPEN